MEFLLLSFVLNMRYILPVLFYRSLEEIADEIVPGAIPTVFVSSLLPPSQNRWSLPDAV